MTPSNFVWYEVMTSDVAAAASFYESTIGWKAARFGLPEANYTTFSMGGTPIAGLTPIPPEARASGQAPCWTGYIRVDDVDAFAGRVTAAGGAIHRAPQDIPEVGRFAVGADPSGAAFILFKPNGGAEQTHPGMTPGRFGWHELYAKDVDRDFAFYAELFGWTIAQRMDMGEGGPYLMFSTGGEPIGGVVTAPADTPPYWLYYFNVEALDATIERVTAAGGKVLGDPSQVPGNSWIVRCADAQGAEFALVASQR